MYETHLGFSVWSMYVELQLGTVHNAMVANAINGASIVTC